MDNLLPFQSLRVSNKTSRAISKQLSPADGPDVVAASCSTSTRLLDVCVSPQATMERCSEIVTTSYSFKPEELYQFEGELPPGHNSGHRRHR